MLSNMHLSRQMCCGNLLMQLPFLCATTQPIEFRHCVVYHHVSADIIMYLPKGFKFRRPALFWSVIAGSILWDRSFANASPGPASGCLPAAGVSTAPDLRERDRREEELRQSEARLRAAADLVGLARYSWNPQTNALDWDARMRAMWGLPRDAHVDYEVWRSALHPMISLASR